MARQKLTMKGIEKLPLRPGKATFYWDSATPGFGVLVPGVADGRRVFVAQAEIHGRAKRITLGPVSDYETIEQARREAGEKRRTMRAGVDPVAEKRRAQVRGRTVQEWLDDFLDAKADLRPSSAAGYRWTVEKYLHGWLSRPLTDITPADVRDRYKALVAAVAGKQRNGVRAEAGFFSGKGTATAAMRSFRALWNHARRVTDDRTGFAENPVSAALVIEQSAARKSRVKASDMPAFHAALVAYPNRVMSDLLRLLFYTGMRRREATALTWAEVDFRERIIRIAASRAKGRRDRWIPMTDLVWDLLVARRALGRDSSDYVFPSNGKTGHIVEVKGAFAKIAADTGIRSTTGSVVTAHDLRRTFTSIARPLVQHLELQALLGHAPHSVTADYDVVEPHELLAPAQRVADRLRGLAQIERPTGANVVSIDAPARA